MSKITEKVLKYWKEHKKEELLREGIVGDERIVRLIPSKATILSIELAEQETIKKVLEYIEMISPLYGWSRARRLIKQKLESLK